uniref:Uncharacterized protein n=1 Tax=Anguilla anguilla TaxID=7936 RepID=A0A0E9Q6D7_ANGAN
MVYQICGERNLTGLQGALTLTPPNAFGMHWNADCKPALLANISAPTWKRIPAATFQNLVESLPRRVEAVIATKGWEVWGEVHINAHGMRV